MAVEQGSQQQVTAGQESQQQKRQQLAMSDTMKAALTTGDLLALTTFLKNQSKE